VSTFTVEVVEVVRSSQATTKVPAVSPAAREPAALSPGTESSAGGPQLPPAGRVEVYATAV
jgi:hypothetical protein